MSFLNWLLNAKQIFTSVKLKVKFLPSVNVKVTKISEKQKTKSHSLCRKQFHHFGIVPWTCSSGHFSLNFETVWLLPTWHIFCTYLSDPLTGHFLLWRPKHPRDERFLLWLQIMEWTLYIKLAPTLEILKSLLKTNMFSTGLELASTQLFGT